MGHRLTNEKVDEIIRFCEELTSTLPVSSPAGAINYYDLGYAYQMRFERQHKPSDMNAAILHLLKCLSGPLSPENRLQVAFDVGKGLFYRFEMTGELQDLSEAIGAFETAASSGTGLDTCEVYDRLGGILATRYGLSNIVVDIEVAPELKRVAVTTARELNHPATSIYLSNLGLALFQRFIVLGVVDDIDEAIRCHKEALSHPKINVVRPYPVPMIQHRLGRELFVRFQYACSKETTVDWSIWTEAIQHLTTSLALVRSTSLGAEDLDLFRTSLARVLTFNPPKTVGPPPKAFNLLGNVDFGIRLYQQVANMEAAAPGARFEAAIRCANYESQRARYEGQRECYENQRVHYEAGLQGYSAAIELFSAMGWNGIAGESRERSTKRLLELGSEAASCAIQLNKLEEAIEISDHVRSLFWDGLSKFRTDTEELRRKAPEIAHKLSYLAGRLEGASFQREIIGNIVSGDAFQSLIPDITWKSEEDAAEYRRLTRAWNSCVQEVRGVPGFEGFLKRRPFSALKSAASAGPVIVLIAATFYSDALIVGIDGSVKRISLTGVTAEKAKGWVDRLRSEMKDKRAWVLREILLDLWNFVGKPVIDGLQASPGQRVWWCPTGNLSLLPIHAAGEYSAFQNHVPGLKSVPENVISSYTISLGRLLDSRSRALSASGGSIPQLLLIAKAEKPSYDDSPPLLFVEDEIKAIQTVFAKSSATDTLCLTEPLLNSQATVDAVLLKLSEFAHFSCHGKQEQMNPILSGLLLHDEPLTLLRLLDHWITHPSRANPTFAFLSACETARGSGLLADQAMHIAAGIQFVGFKRVIATMWYIQDKFAISVSGSFYEELLPALRENKGEWDAGTVLHKALLKARKRDRNLWHWVPYIHMGI